MVASANSESPRPYQVVFVCTGNICRSPMADIIFRDHLANTDLAQRVEVSSCGTGGWHIGDKADHRALQELQEAGYDGSRHRARQVDSSDEHADLLIALDRGHRRTLVERGIEADKIRLLKEFSPTPLDEEALDVADPYYGTAQDFRIARQEIEDCIPALLAFVGEQVQ